MNRPASDVSAPPRIAERCIRLLAAWQRPAERWWYDLPGRPGLGCYGTGYDAWGVQTNQKYAAAMAMLAASEGAEAHGGDRDLALSRALAAYRFSLASHVSGPRDVTCTDGRKWGRTWISSLGVERMMHGLAAIDDHLTDDDRAAVRRVLTSEAGWLLNDYRKGSHSGVVGDVWNASNKNVPESNLWNGAMLWRAAQMSPDHPDAAAWRERAHEFLVNSVSIAADAEDDRVVAGKPIRERFRGANFFPNYALDHHGYLNVGYMVICVSNAAMLHFDLRRLGLDEPQTLHHHQADLWDVLRRMIFADGRLARIGGDTRVRYAYCQEYLLPSLLYAADQLCDPHALPLAARQLDLIEQEQAANGDGTFYGKRLAPMVAQSPYYYTRLESDRANALGMVLAYQPLVKAPPPPQVALEADLAGGWSEPEHGAALHRSPTRLASFAWRAQGIAQAMCTPPDDGHLAEWSNNLVGSIRFVGEVVHNERRVVAHTVDTFSGGFATCGSIVEGADVVIAEGWRGEDVAVRHIAVAALPDEHTMVVLQWIVAADRRTYTRGIKGMQWGVPNDLFNGHRRTLDLGGRTVELSSPAERDEVVDLATRAALVDGRVGVVGVYGAESLVVDRSRARRGGKFGSLHVEELCWGHDATTRDWAPGATMYDTGYAIVCGADPERFWRFAAEPELKPLTFADAPMVRGVSLVSLRDIRRAVLANFGDADATVTLPTGRKVTLPAGHATVV